MDAYYAERRPSDATPPSEEDLILRFATDLNCAADDFIERYRELTHAEVPEHIAKLISILDNEIINKLYGFPWN